MKYGAHTFLWIERWSNSELNLISRGKSLGLECLEISIGDDVEFDPAKIKKQAALSGIEIIISPGGDWPWKADISLPDSNDRTFALKWHKHWIDQGARAGATAYTGALYGHPGRIIKEKPVKGETERIADGLYELAAHGASRGLKIVIEPMSHFRTHIINTPEQALALIQATGHPNLFVLLDTYHLITETRNMEEAILTLAPFLWGIHACENDRGVPGKGLVPWDQVFRGLKKIQFDGYCILESYNSTIHDGNFAISRGMFHNPCPDGDEFAKQGLGFLRRY
jgi:D-psicose/D-tagatose/L-ribulose 3-epimerase